MEFGLFQVGCIDTYGPGGGTGSGSGNNDGNNGNDDDDSWGGGNNNRNDKIGYRYYPHKGDKLYKNGNFTQTMETQIPNACVPAIMAYINI